MGQGEHGNRHAGEVRAWQQVYDERYQAKYGFWRPIIERSVTAFLPCGDLHQGFARVRCADCHHEMFVSCST
jgi:hypothetical protein